MFSFTSQTKGDPSDPQFEPSQEIDPENATVDQVEIYMKMLKLFKSSFKKTAGEF